MGKVVVVGHQIPSMSMDQPLGIAGRAGMLRAIPKSPFHVAVSVELQLLLMSTVDSDTVPPCGASSHSSRTLPRMCLAILFVVVTVVEVVVVARVRLVLKVGVAAAVRNRLQFLLLLHLCQPLP